MRQVDDAWWQRAATEGLQARARRQAGDLLRPLPPMYTPLKLAGLALAHRVVMAPMAQYQADALGRVGDWHLMHYGSHAQGLPAILYGEMTAVSPEGRITPDDADADRSTANTLGDLIKEKLAGKLKLD